LEKKSKFATFVLSFFVPGTGHLYLGYNTRGLQLMAAFFGCIVLMPTLPMLCPFLVAIVWFYSMFDALQRATYLNLRSQENVAQGQSEPVEPPMEQDFLTDHPVLIGVILIVLGILVFLGILFPDFWFLVRRLHLGTVLVAVAMIAFGVWLIRSQKSHEQK
jgi:TM2 domain-containing membrane protein YozV